MTPYDELLTWASEKREGSLDSLRRSCRWIADCVGGGVAWRDVHDDLLALGHVDIVDGRWVVAPPILSRLADGGGNSLLVGERPRWLEDALTDLDGYGDPEVSALGDYVYENHRVEQAGPSSWYLAIGRGAPRSGLDKLGIRMIDDVAGALLVKATKAAAGGLRRTVRPGDLSARLAQASFATGIVEWEPVREDRGPGLYMYLRNNQRVFAERRGEDWLEVDERWGTWRHGSGKTFWFVPRDRRLYVPAARRLPLEVERALHLRSGRLPMRGVAREATGTDREFLCFENVTHEVAKKAADLVTADLEM